MEITSYEDMQIAVRGHFKLDSNNEPQRIVRKVSGVKRVAPNKNSLNKPTFTLTFDTETCTDTSQQLRVGYYELRGMSNPQTKDDLDTLVEAGFILGAELFNGDNEIITRHVEQISYRGKYKNIEVKILTEQQFIKDVFYAYGYHGKCPGSTATHKEYARIVGFNLPFDISRFVTKYGAAHRDFDGGFYFVLCDCPHALKTGNCAYHPPLRIKKLGRNKYMYSFRHESTLSKSGTRQLMNYNGHFVDAQTLGIALSPSDNGHSLATMCQQYKVENKDEHPDFNAPINDVYLQYLIQDVRSTYYLFRAETDFYNQWGFSKKPEMIYSQASMAKTLLQELGIPPYYAGERDDENNIGWDISDEIRGCVAATIHGGRAEIGTRLTMVESILLDFASEYPLINNLLKLQDFWTNDNVRAIDATNKARKILGSNNLLNKLQDKSFWLNMRMIVAVKDVPKNKPTILPIRAKYNKTIYNEALPYVAFNGVIWYTMADVIASVLLTGNVPTIEKAYEFVAIGNKRTTNTIKLMGDDKYTIDLTRDDLYTRLIDLRHEIDKSIATSDNPDLLKAISLSLKLIANSGSYGIQLEQNPLERDTKMFKLNIYANDYQRARAYTYDVPGRYFAGPIATLIPAGGRLLLAMCERLAHDKGLHYAFMDTDSICVTRPLKTLGQKEISRDEFRKRVSEIADYFKPLNPYANSKEVLKYERINYDEHGNLRVLYCIAVSSKRYVLFERLDNKEYNIVKLSSHGLGGWFISGDYKIPSHIPHKPKTLNDCHDYIYSLWYNFIRTIDTGYYHGDRVPLKSNDCYYVYGELDTGLEQLAMSQYTLAHPGDMTRFQYDGIMPFNFITVMPQPSAITTFNGTHDYGDASGYYTKYCNTEKELRQEIKNGNVYRIKDGAKALDDTDIFNTMQQALFMYFRHNEAKALNGNTVGIMQRRHIWVLPHAKVIGKESNRIAVDDMHDTSQIVGGRLNKTNTNKYGDTIEYADTQIGNNNKLSEDVITMLLSNDTATIMSVSGLSLNVVSRIRNNIYDDYRADTINALESAAILLNPNDDAGILVNWRNKISPASLATVLNVDNSTAKNKYMGRLTWSVDDIENLAEYFIDKLMN